MLFEIQFRTLSPLGFTRKYSWREKKESHEDSKNEGFNPFSVSIMFRNFIGAVGGKAGGINRDAIIAVRRHVIPLRGKRWVIHDWGLVKTCVGIFRVSIGMSFEVFLQFLLYPYNYNYELYINYRFLMNHLMSQ